jgi:membrane protease YdiL (CAAX protease family)
MRIMLGKLGPLHDSETATELKVTRSAWRRFFFPDNLRPPPFRAFWGRYLSLVVLSVAWSVLLHHHRLWLSWDLEVCKVWAFGFEFRGDSAPAVGMAPADLSAFVNKVYLGVSALITAVYIGTCLAVYGLKNLRVAARTSSFRIIAKYVLLVAGVMVLGGYLMELLGLYSGDPAGKEERPLRAVLIVSVFVGLVGPIAEEICVRLTLYQLLRTRISFFWAALLSGTIFGLMHFGYPDPMKMVGATLAGFVLAWSYERTNSILTPIGIHVLNNTWMVVLSLS